MSEIYSMNATGGRKTATTEHKRFRQKTAHPEYEKYDRPLNSETNNKS